MATAVTKKPTPNQATGPRTLADCPEWKEALTIRKRLEEQLRRYVVVADAPAGDVSIVRQLVGKLLSWAKGTSATPEPEQLASPAVGNASEQREAARLALDEHNQATERLRLQLAGELYPAWSDEHLRARQRIAQAAVALKTSIDAEQRLAEQMAAAGALSDAGFGRRLWVNCANAAQLPRLFRPMNLTAFRRDNADLLD